VISCRLTFGTDIILGQQPLRVQDGAPDYGEPSSVSGSPYGLRFFLAAINGDKPRWLIDKRLPPGKLLRIP
jgi:hypothetical protein